MVLTSTPDIHLLMLSDHSLSSILEHEGFRSVGVQAHHASNFEEMKHALSKRRIDAILIDWEYERVNPFLLMKNLRAHPKSKTLPIIVTSIHRCDERIEHSDWVDLFVKQPIPRVILLERIRRLLKKRHREHQRYSASDLYLSKISVHTQGKDYIMHVADISLSGAFLYSQKSLPVGTTLSLQITLPEWKNLVTVEGQIVRITRMHKIKDAANKGIAIEFKKFLDDGEELLQNFLEENKPSSNFMRYYL